MSHIDQIVSVWVPLRILNFTCSSSSGQHAGEKFPEVRFLVVADEELLVLFFEGEIQSLGGKVSDDVGQISSPEWPETLRLFKFLVE